MADLNNDVKPKTFQWDVGQCVKPKQNPIGTRRPILGRKHPARPLQSFVGGLTMTEDLTTEHFRPITGPRMFSPGEDPMWRGEEAATRANLIQIQQKQDGLPPFRGNYYYPPVTYDVTQYQKNRQQQDKNRNPGHISLGYDPYGIW